jgi:hypothetical protein
MRTQVAVKNGVPVSLTNGSMTRLVPFDGPLPATPTVRPGNYPVVTLASTLGGLPFTATLVSVAVKVPSPGPFAVVLLGATVETSDGYSGVVAPEHCAGPGIIVD